MITSIIGHVQRSNGYTEIKFTTMYFQELECNKILKFLCLQYTVVQGPPPILSMKIFAAGVWVCNWFFERTDSCTIFSEFK
jgi:hypothetical protein